MARPDSAQIEPRFKETIDAWVKNARPTGSFIEAAIENNLKECFARGDEAALENLPHIVAYLYNKCPAHCWGSPEKARAWTLAGGIDGIKRDNARNEELDKTWEHRHDEVGDVE